MKIFQKKNDVKAYLAPAITTKQTIGFVPTMGALHQGHLSLVQRALSENDLVVVSIFVNPTQFNNAEDLEKYPRTLQADIDKLESVSTNILIYTPEAEDIYNGNISSDSFDFEGLDLVMEGASRPGHFDGVGTIVKKLFEIVTPTNAYFGEKDYQQILIIKSMVRTTKLPVNIVPCPIVREANGLAMSSRNQRLSDEMKQKASFIYQSLQEVQKLFQTEEIASIQKWIKMLYNTHSEFHLEYFNIAHSDTLQPVLQKKQGEKYHAFIVVHLQGVRLIDNIELL